MNDNGTQKICGEKCRWWRRCNYCRFSYTNWGGSDFPYFYCKNTVHPMCYDGEGFSCIFQGDEDICINGASPYCDKEKKKKWEESFE
jgi:hypothetical protein